MKETIIAMLRPFADACHRLAGRIPLDGAAGIHVLFLVILAIWVLTLKGEKPSRTRESKIGVFPRDLRFWAVLILFTQALIYAVLR